MILVEDFNTPLSTTGRTPRQKVSKDTEELNTTNKHQDLINTS